MLMKDDLTYDFIVILVTNLNYNKFSSNVIILT